MTVVEEKEYLRRKGEDDRVKDLDSKIEAVMAKIDNARSDRNNEVIRINKRRENYDDMLKTREEKRSVGSRIQEEKLKIRANPRNFEEQRKKSKETTGT
ncbi:hypothetical protein B9Z55_028569 [Caenorhabditis nigoni]|uniref:Uncharacterized protein n=1 Tax=Caenorhabditis nigoni TaxID=1611254 RepID=A0A2G5SAW5_9PELO|nr:hypothetical protein B9Z55_028569 [Caenorhabditis nigoni]